MKKIYKIFGLNTVRKKVFLLSKLTGGIIVLFYVITMELPAEPGVSFFIWLVLMMTVILGVDFLLGRFISKPLDEINKTAEQMAGLKNTAHCDIDTDDEFGELSAHLNTMFFNLQETMGKLEIANEQLEKDVEQEHLLLTQRKELTDNLSHELKTPLGIIRAYTEGLKEEQNEQKKQLYIDTILSAANRMNIMIVSLLDLSAMEAGAAKLSEERFDFVELVETVAGRLLIDTPNTKHEFTYNLPEEKVFIYADKIRMEQVLNNLIENAGKHAEGDCRIHLSVSTQENSVRFSIWNQGRQIPEQNIPKIWQKFYRGEMPQGKESSGLGLAIVAQILSMYQTEYGVQNQSEGVLFYFVFKTIK